MSLLAGAVTVIATGTASAGRPSWRGMTATAVCSLCAEPPSIVVCLNRAAGTYQDLAVNEIFSVNILSVEQRSIAEMFAGLVGLTASDRFTDTGWRAGRLGVPVLVGTLATLECRAQRHMDYGTHAVVIGTVEAAYWAAPNQGTGVPLIYHARQFARGTGDSQEKGIVTK